MNWAGWIAWLGPNAAQPAPPPWLEDVRREQVAGLYRNLLVGMMSAWLGAAVLCVLFVQQHAVAKAVAIAWFALISALTLARVVLAATYKRSANARAEWRAWAAWFTTGCIVSGFAWGLGTLFFMAPGRFDLQLLIVLTLSALVYGGLASFGRWTPAFYGFFFPAMAPSAVWSLLQGDVVHLAYSLLAALWIPSVALLAQRFGNGVEQALALGFENAALAEDLRKQKQVADDANLAKSRFLAAASHDLRQPVHALGLLVGALRHEKLAPEAAQLVEQIDTATGSLDELFTSLLDVSRLDAGVVQPRQKAIALRPMLLRLAAELRPTAEAKGLVLKLRAADLWARSDAVMLERVIRNLLSNAVRYTDRGGVLVAARKSGSRISIEVWDTGPGIAEHVQALVFREFYQVEGRRGDRGLGLGLAIVQRLCALLQHPLELRSKPGRGSLFRVRVPACEPHIEPAPAPEPALSGGARVWVIDDDAGVRAGMRALLSTWGYDVRAAESGDDMLRVFDQEQRMPDVILCDYRLAGEDGVAVIARLRARLGVQAPAALITGDTAPEQLREAGASGLPILHKPVAKARLRALIGNLARAGSETA